MNWFRRRGGRLVRIDGDATHAVFTLGDNSPIVVYSGAHPRFSLTSLLPAPAVPTGTGPALLLAARHEVVPFVGREETRATTAGWLARDEPRAVRLVFGPGGQGKTRLATRVARDAAARGWQVMVARHHLDGGQLATGTDVEPPVSPIGLLLLVDYADRWGVEDLLTLLAGPEAAGAPRLRVLLLGRSAGFWTSLSQTLNENGMAVSQIRLQGLPDDLVIRELMFEAAVEAFDVELSRQDPDLGARRGSVARPDLTAAGFGLTLAVQMSALVELLRVRDDPAMNLEGGLTAGELSDPAAVSRQLLAREIGHWGKLQKRSPDPLRLSTEVMARAVMTATLTRGLEVDEGVVVLDRLRLGGESQDVIDEHGRCYPVTTPGRVLEPLYPDRLGEDFTAVLIPGGPPDPEEGGAPLEPWADPSAPGIVNILLEGPPRDADTTTPSRGPVLTALVETARRWPHVAAFLHDRLEGEPGLLLEGGGTVVTRAAPIPALRPLLPRVGQALNRMIGVGTHLDLDPGSVSVQEQLVELTRSNSDDVGLAEALTLLAVRLIAVGRSAEALVASEEAVERWRTLVALDRSASLDGLADALSNLATYLAAEGRLAEALGVAEEAVGISQELVQDRGNDDVRAVFGLLTSLGNLGAYQSEAGLHDEALATTEMVAEGWRTVVDVEPDITLSSFTNSLINLSVSRAEIGQLSDALEPAEEAVERAEQLAARDRSAYLPLLAAAFSNVAVRLAAVGRRADALGAGEQDIHLTRELVEVNPVAYLPTLALALNNHAGHLADEGHREAALNAVRESIEIRRRLIEKNRPANLPGLRDSLSNLTVELAALGRHGEAVAAGEEAVGLARELVTVNRAAHLDALALVLSNLGAPLAELGRGRDALEKAKEAVALRRELVTRHRAAHLHYLAGAVGNLAKFQAGVGQRAEALDSNAESVALTRELSKLNREVYLPILGTSLNNQAQFQAALGLDALAAATEAVEVFRQLVSINRLVFLPDLGMAVDTLAANLAVAGRGVDALAAAEEAHSVRGELAEIDPGTYLPGFAESVMNLAVHQSRLGRTAEAVATARRSVGLCQKLVAADRSAHLFRLAGALNNLGADLGTAGERGPALEAVAEALRLRRELVSVDRDAHLPSLAESLVNIAIRQFEMGRTLEALRSAREGEQYLAELAARYPGRFSRNLDISRQLVAMLSRGR